MSKFDFVLIYNDTITALITATLLDTKWHYLKINSRMIELDIMSTSAGTAILIAAVMLVFYEFCMITWLLVNQLVLTTPETVSLLMDSKLFFCQCA